MKKKIEKHFQEQAAGAQVLMHLLGLTAIIVALFSIHNNSVFQLVMAILMGLLYYHVSNLRKESQEMLDYVRRKL